MHRKTLPSLLLVLFAIALVPSAASAATNVSVGIGDQSPAMFSDPNFKKLKVKKVRYFIRWNTIDNPGELALADAYVNAAKANKVRVLMHISTDKLVRARKNPSGAAKLPSVKQYKSKVGALVKRYGGKKLDWGVWNEANHDTQPTYKSPKRAAQFFVAMRSMCKGCTIVALDVLDQNDAVSYMNRFFKALKPSQRGAARIIGLHNYSDTNRYRQKGRKKAGVTRAVIAAMKKKNKRAKLWLTETGGVMKAGGIKCTGSRSKVEKRQANATSDMFTMTKTFRANIGRLYSYNWYGTDCKTDFDAGLVRADGSPRPAYKTFASRIKRFKR